MFLVVIIAPTFLSIGHCLTSAANSGNLLIFHINSATGSKTAIVKQLHKKQARNV